jgi:uncharacterized protein (DUF2235 family)
MPKTLAVFFDGTWNRPEEFAKPSMSRRLSIALKAAVGGKRDSLKPTTPVTNVLKLMRAVWPSTSSALVCANCQKPECPTSPQDQVSLYIAGVGTDPSPSSKALEGLCGYGVDRNIQLAYHFVTQNYVPGDSLFLFGFSRGAFTARSFAGFLDVFGFIAPSEMSRLPAIYAKYEKMADAAGLEATQRWASDYVKKHRGWRSEATIDVWFLGVWDTVGALRRFDRRLTQFHQVELPNNVARAYHAIAVHEFRQDFQPVFWTKNLTGRSNVEQVWFPGAHSDIGGGYPEGETGLSNISLKWMACKAMDAGLSMDTEYLKALIAAPKTMEFHDSHQGSIIKWGDPRPRDMTRAQLHPADPDFWATVRVHASATVFSPVAPTGSGHGKDVLRSALVEAQKQVTSLEAELPLGAGVVHDSCRW